MGISNLAVHTLFRLFNHYGFTDLFFYDTGRGIRSIKKLAEFDIIVFTFPYELDYVKALEILQENGIPPLRSDRNGSPLLIAGGIAVSSNPAVLSPFFDVIAVGEAEAIIPELMEAILNAKDVLESLCDKEWAYIPGLKEKAKRSYLKEAEKFLSYSAFTDERAYFSETFLVEISRGCPHKCRFCLLGYFTLPPRFMPSEKIKEILDYFGEVENLGLVSSAVAEHPEFESILDQLRDDIRVTVSSLRIDSTSVRVLEELKKKGLVTLTVAPEAGSERLRQKINKAISDEKILEFAELAHKLGFHRMKLYFMLGLPGEEEADVEAINDLVARIKKTFRAQISVTVSPFVPKPHTPFEELPYPETATLRARLKRLKMPRGVKLGIEGLRSAEIQAILSRGDSLVGIALLNSLLERKSLHKALKDLGRDPGIYLRDPNYLRKAPFHSVSTGVKREFLRAELEKASKGEVTPRCVPKGCKMCGLCG